MRSNGIAGCPEELPEPLTSAVRDFASAWAASSLRPRVSLAIRRRWHALLEAWAQDDSLPLLIRRSSAGRGSVLTHSSGRSLVPTDNSPAKWSLSLALSGTCPTLDDVRAAISADAIPVAMMFHKKEKLSARFHCTRGKAAQLNALGWKVAHIEDVGLGRGTLESVEFDRLAQHFLRFLSPGNMFVVPLKWAGIAELPEVAAAMRCADENAA